jgi:hypothetical protein
MPHLPIELMKNTWSIQALGSLYEGQKTPVDVPVFHPFFLLAVIQGA